MIKVPQFVLAIFTDSRWRQIGRYMYYGEIDGLKYGAVIASMSPDYDTFAQNVADTERLLAGKRDGKIDGAVIVAAKVNGAFKFEFFAAVDAEEFYNTVLKNREPKLGKRGKFWSIDPFTFDPDAPF